MLPTNNIWAFLESIQIKWDCSKPQALLNTITINDLKILQKVISIRFLLCPHFDLKSFTDKKKLRIENDGLLQAQQ